MHLCMNKITLETKTIVIMKLNDVIVYLHVFIQIY